VHCSPWCAGLCVTRAVSSQDTSEAISRRFLGEWDARMQAAQRSASAPSVAGALVSTFAASFYAAASLKFMYACTPFFPLPMRVC